MAKEQFEIPPLDINNQPINTGDVVVFGMSGSMNLLMGVVKKINKKTVTVQHIEVCTMSGFERILETMYNRTFDNVVVIK
jgi:hypothetical protein